MTFQNVQSVNLNVDIKARAMMGFFLGLSLGAQVGAGLALRAMGFVASSDGLDVDPGYVLWSRVQNDPRPEVFDIALSLEYDQDGVVSKMVCLIGKFPGDGPSDRAMVAGELRDFVIRQIGDPCVKLDRIDNWSTEPSSMTRANAAYAGLWLANPNQLQSIPVPQDIVEFMDAMREVNGDTLVAWISSSLGGVIATIEMSQSRIPC